MKRLNILHALCAGIIYGTKKEYNVEVVVAHTTPHRTHKTQTETIHKTDCIVYLCTAFCTRSNIYIGMIYTTHIAREHNENLMRIYDAI